MRPGPRPPRSSGGFTLVELVLVIVVVGIIAALGGLMLNQAVDSYGGSRDIGGTDAQARLALARLGIDLRQASAFTAADLTSTNQISFTDTAGNTVTYDLSGTTLMRNGEPLADGVTALGFAYLEQDGKTAATAPANVYTVTVTLTFTQGGASATYRTTVRPRSF